MSGFKDHFSGHAGDYARYRPRYPEALFDWLADIVPARDAAWDCGTGNGQAAVALAGHFRRVIATDPSAEQLANAAAHPRVSYVRATAEDPGLADRSVDLVTVAQALHWFDLEAFYAEVRRVLRPAGVIAAWTYRLIRVSPKVDRLVEALHTDICGAWWPPERRHVDNGYVDLPFPFETIDAPPFRIEAEWTLDALLAYLRTWSAVRRYMADRREDPVAALSDRLTTAWGDPAAARTVRWPLILRVGRVPAASG